MGPTWKLIAKVSVIPAAVVGYITVAGLTGFCPSCKSIVDSVRGRTQAMSIPSGAPTNIAGLTGYTLEGDRVELTKYAGKPMVLEFWATWCPPCRSQREIVHASATDLLKDASFVSMSVDTNPAVVQSFLKDHPSDTVELMAPPEVSRAFSITAVPTLVFVDAAGAVRGVSTGVHSANELRARLRELAAK